MKSIIFMVGFRYFRWCKYCNELKQVFSKYGKVCDDCKVVNEKNRIKKIIRKVRGLPLKN